MPLKVMTAKMGGRVYNIPWEYTKGKGLNLWEWFWKDIKEEVVLEMGIKRARNLS